MENRSEGGWAVAAICVVAILLLLGGGGGVGIYYVLRQQQILREQQMEALMQAERAAMAEAEARMRAELASKALREVTDDPSSATGADTNRAAIEAVLRAQEEAWNQGDLSVFMEHYWKSESLTFSSGGQTTRGWTETLQRYRDRYPTTDAMGRLTLGDLETTPLGDSAALVLGKWNLERDTEPVSGGFSLVLRKFEGRRLIVHDHTSRTIEQKTE